MAIEPDYSRLSHHYEPIVFLFTSATPVNDPRLPEILEFTEASIVSFRILSDKSFQADYFSAGFTQIFGYTPQELFADPQLWLSRVYPADLDSVILPCLAERWAEKSFSHQFRFYHKDGTLRWITSHYTVKRETPEDSWRVMVISTDISDHKAAETRWRQYEKIVSAIIDPIAIVDCDHRYVLVNPAYLEHYHQSLETVIGQEIKDAVTEEVYQSEVQSYLDRCLAGEVVQYERYCLDLVRGKEFLGFTYLPYQETDDTVSGVIITIRYLTSLKKAEIALLQQAEQGYILANMTNHVRESMDLSAILQTTVAEVLNYLQCDHVLVYRLKADVSEQGKIIAQSVADNCTKHPECNPQFYLPSSQNGQIQSIADIYTASLTEKEVEHLSYCGIRANLVIPIKKQGQLWGLLLAQTCHHPRQWEDEEIELLQQLMEQLAIAIQQSELYEHLQILNTKLQAMNIQLQYLANYDSLTQIANRRYFNDYLMQEWERLKRDNAGLSLILADVDYFKGYNDTYGHPEGDRCLLRIAQALERSVSRPADLVARYGGEEFAIILPHTNAEGAIQVVKRIQQEIQRLDIAHRDSLVSDQVTLSFGIACAHLTTSDPHHLLKKADKALYWVKQHGRNQWQIRE